MDWLHAPRDPVIDLDGEDVPIRIRTHPRARRLTLRLAPDGNEVRITLPRWASAREAVAFAHARADWLRKTRAAIPRAQPPCAGGTLAFRGRDIAIVHDAALPRRPALSGDTVSLGGPADTLPARLRRWLEAQALEIMTHDLAHYCAAIDREPPQIALSRAQRRWGSCSDKGVVRVNWRLVQAPDDVRRSVVAHEVAHLVHFDHSPAFHALLADLFEGDLDFADDWLRRHGRALYARFG
jgi:predicted metal-dependent hydrolase